MLFRRPLNYQQQKDNQAPQILDKPLGAAISTREVKDASIQNLAMANCLKRVLSGCISRSKVHFRLGVCCDVRISTNKRTCDVWESLKQIYYADDGSTFKGVQIRHVYSGNDTNGHAVVWKKHLDFGCHQPD
ncbi:hypothetical protein Fot_15136 [Forsythia ovata]|uniref:Uncharacterized protein n=1 Tax=Forsythia ovata TaxID=205694 RepID=A0ABD1WAQ1_9LAMI